MKWGRGSEHGFTLIELLIVVAILGVLAGVVIPNVGRFIGKGETEAADTEFSNVQSAVVAMMVDNLISELPNPVLEANATSNMAVFPDTSAIGAGKETDPNGDNYQAFLDKGGYILYEHDLWADGTTNDLVNYVATQFTKGTYYVNSSGTVFQKTTGYE